MRLNFYNWKWNNYVYAKIAMFNFSKYMFTLVGNEINNQRQQQVKITTSNTKQNCSACLCHEPVLMSLFMPLPILVLV